MTGNGGCQIGGGPKKVKVALTEEGNNPNDNGRTSLEDLLQISISRYRFFVCTHEYPGPSQQPSGTTHEGNTVGQKAGKRARNANNSKEQTDTVLKMVTWVPEGKTGEGSGQDGRANVRYVLVDNAGKQPSFGDSKT